jgi:hypothetical protein
VFDAMRRALSSLACSLYDGARKTAVPDVTYSPFVINFETNQSEYLQQIPKLKSHQDFYRKVMQEPDLSAVT